MKSVFGDRHRKTYFFPIFCIFYIENDNGGPVGTWGFKEGGEEIKQIVKKYQKSAKSEKSEFFY